MTSDNTTPHRASKYNTSVRQTIPHYEAIHREILEWAAVLRPDVTCWLDTGCGTGYLVEQALPGFPQTRFILTDPSEAMLAKARMQFAGETRVQFLPPVMSAELRRYTGEIQPQIITAVLCHHYVRPEERRASVAACYELLAPGGVLMVVENSAPRSEAGVAAALECWGRFQMRQGRSPEVVADHLKRYDRAYFPITVDAHLALLHATGFQTVELFWYTCIQAGFYAIKPIAG